MKYNKKAVNSDSSSEDRGYDPRHRQTEGGYQAYARGEQPMTYWNKKTILNGIYKKIQEMSERKGDRNKNLIANVLNNADLKVSDYLKELSKLKHVELKDKYLQYTGVHYTGSHYRYTKFYGIVPDEVIAKDIYNRYKSPIGVQLPLPLELIP